MTTNGHRRLDKIAEAVAGAELGGIEDRRIGSPLSTIGSYLAYGSMTTIKGKEGYFWSATAEFIDAREYLTRIYRGWVKRFGAELVGQVLDALLSGRIVYDPERTDRNGRWSPPGGWGTAAEDDEGAKW